MRARFLRSEAARFRVMAEETDREQTRIRLLAMADDFDARARAADDATAAMPPEPPADPEGPEPSSAEATEPTEEDGKPKSGRPRGTTSREGGASKRLTLGRRT
ncbi:MAG: hypothetical protein U1E70_07645 [Acetobacteraceae bacterium]|nr:hypothetical protein [Pseudomonadota bacterium]